MKLRDALPYDPLWTTRLIRRDLKSLATKLFKTSNNSPPSREQPKRTRNVLQKRVSPRFEIVSSVVSTATTTTAVSKGVSKDWRCSGASTAWTEDSEVDLASPDAETTAACQTLEIPCERITTTTYASLETKLVTLYATRDRNTSHDERWLYRGGWLVLFLAIQSIRFAPTPCTTRPQRKLFLDLWTAIVDAADAQIPICSAACTLLAHIRPGKPTRDLLRQLGDPGLSFSERDVAALQQSLATALRAAA